MSRALTGPLSFGLSKAIASPEGVGGSIIASIFADGTDGFYFDFSKTDRLFQNLTGTPADGAGENIHLGLEGSKWQGRAYEAQVARQTELVTNGTFDTDVAGWSLRAATQGIISWNAGAMRFERQTGLSAAATQLISSFVVGRLYRISARVRVVSGPGQVGVQLRSSDGGGGSDLSSGAALTSSTSFVAQEIHWVATQTSAYISLRAGSDGTIVEGDDISVKELPGNHGLQATTAAQPKWQTGGLARFDGSDDNLLTTLVPATAMTLMFKCKLTSLLAGAIVITGSRVTGTDSRFYLGFNSDEALITIIGNTTVTRTGSLLDTVGVAALVLSGGVATLYWNGVEGASGVVGSTNTTIALPLGALNTSGVLSAFFPGDIYYGLAIQKALSAAEIAAITNLWGTS